MADHTTKTTSSKSLDENEKTQQQTEQKVKASVATMPKPTEAHMMTKLATSLTESYQMVKQRQQKYNELSLKLNTNAMQETAQETSTLEDWQEVGTNKNKLKRKKKLSSSLTSVSDSVNQEKRTRIEGMQLNCRGKLPQHDTATAVSAPPTPTHCCVNAHTSHTRSEAKIATKPPLPSPSAQVSVKREDTRAISNQQPTQAELTASAKAPPPPRLKRKLQENMVTIQKLNALTEQLRTEINELKTNLSSERSAVRVLRAQNESESRKWKNEVKKLHNSVELLKKSTSVGALRKPNDANALCVENLPATSSTSASTSSLVNHEIQRLTNEILALKEANKASEEKKMINSDADRRKAADIRELRDSYEIRLTQLTKSAKTEISRLLEEIKTKERNIGQLKKELQQQQQSSRINLDSLKSRNATNKTNATTNKTTNKTTIKTQAQRKQQQQQQKTQPEKKKNLNKNEKEITAKTTTTTKSTDQPENKQENNEENQQTNQQDNQQDMQQGNDKEINDVQNANEMKQLKDLELINNSRNLQETNNNNNTIIKNSVKETIKLFNATQSIKLKLESEERTQTAEEEEETLKCNNDTKQTMLNETKETQENIEPLLNHTTKQSTTITLTTTPSMLGNENAKEHHSLPHELLTEHMIGTHNEAHDYNKAKDNNSDSDSAVSSAPPSISPQPPPNGMDTADIWQTLQNYSSDIEKLQKDLELLQKENAELREELKVAKEQIMESEKSALAAANNTKLQQLMERIRYLEEQEHQLQAESDELREQNELLEFRILELEDNSSDKWTHQSSANHASCNANTSNQKDVWSCGKTTRNDPMVELFGPRKNSNMDDRFSAPSPCDINLIDHLSNDELRHRLQNMQQRLPLHEDDRQCLQQMLSLLQNLDVISQRSGPNSLNTNSSEEPSSLELVKSRISDYSSASSESSSTSSSSSSAAAAALSSTTSSSASSVRSTISSNSFDIHLKPKSSAHFAPTTGTSSSTSTLAATTSTNSRIIATVLPYNSTSTGPYQHQAPTNTPADSPRKVRNAWQSNSLSESGVFVESDFLSDASENNVCTQTDFEEATQAAVTATAKELTTELLKLEQVAVTAAYLTSSPRTQPATAYCDPKSLQYYKERLELLESKVLIYESSGDIQAKRLADRLQREIQLEKQVKDLRDRVDFLESENASLEEEKCEFEEAENDTRLRLQRLEVELEILSQRNLELEMSREALSAKYKDCRSECLILRDDLSVSETQIRHLEEDKQKAKVSLEFLHSTLPLFMLYSVYAATTQQQQQQLEYEQEAQLAQLQVTPTKNMGNTISSIPATNEDPCSGFFERQEPTSTSTCKNACQQRELEYLKEEIKILRHQIKDLNSRHYEALESADSHWVDLEKDYKEREECYRAKESCLKQKINRLQDCLRDDARAANEKICQLEEGERELKSCLLRISKEHRELLQDHQNYIAENQCLKEQNEKLKAQSQPLKDALEMEKKRNKTLTDELNFMRKLQTESESRSLHELETMRAELFEVKKEYLHIEVTNSELKEEVLTLEKQILKFKESEQIMNDKVRVLTDEVRTKEEMCAKLENQVQRTEGFSLAQELNGSPSKRCKRDDIIDLQTASKGLGCALRNMKECNLTLPSHQRFTCVARDVKKLADAILGNDAATDEDGLTESGDNRLDTAAPAEEKVSPKLEPVPNETAEYDPPQISIKTEPIDDVTVGMVLMPVNNLHSSSMHCNTNAVASKKQIFEVPSEMRKLKDTMRPIENYKDKDKEKDKIKEYKREMYDIQSSDEWTEEGQSKKRSHKLLKRAQRRRAVKMSLRARVRRIVSCMHNKDKRTYQDVSDVYYSQTHVIHRNISYESFHSIKDDEEENKPLEEIVAKQKVDAWTEMEVEHKDQETATQVQSCEFSVQVNDEAYTERLLDVFPPVVREFFNLLQSSISQTCIHTRHYNEELRKRWEHDDDFREGIDILQNFATYDLTNEKGDVPITIDNYENFVNALTCLHELEEIYKPVKIPLLQQIEDQINEQLMNFHSKKMESEFYCTVYYPVKRQVPLNMSDFIIT